MPAKRGDALILRPLVLHASSKPSGSSLRRVLHFVFGPEVLPYQWPGEGGAPPTLVGHERPVATDCNGVGCRKLGSWQGRRAGRLASARSGR